VIKYILILCSIFLFIGCAELKPISGGIERPDGLYVLEGTESIQVEIKRMAIGTQIGRVEVIVRNLSDSPIEIDHAKTIITSDSGEQLVPLDPDQAASSISTDAFSTAILGPIKAQSTLQGAAGEVRRTGIGKVMIQPKMFIEGVFFFKPPLNRTTAKTIKFKFNGIPGTPEVSFQTGTY